MPDIFPILLALYQRHKSVLEGRHRIAPYRASLRTVSSQRCHIYPSITPVKQFVCIRHRNTKIEINITCHIGNTNIL